MVVPGVSTTCRKLKAMWTRGVLSQMVADVGFSRAETPKLDLQQQGVDCGLVTQHYLH